jgi:hypothetical protein
MATSITELPQAGSIDAGSRGPTAELNINPNAFASMSYPSDLHSAKKGHFVKFYINALSESTFNTSTSTSIDPTTRTTLFADSTVFMSPERKRLTGTIELYMPDSVNMSYQASYQEDNQSDYTIPYYGALGQDIFNIYKSGGTPSESQTQNFFSKNMSLGVDALAGLRDTLNRGGLISADALLNAQGVAINPQIQLLFKAVGLRQFQMEFMFSPKSLAESNSVREIVQTFKFHAAPEVGGTTTGGRSSGLFFRVPSTFNIEFHKKEGGENPYVHKIGESVLENITVDYAPNGWSAFSVTGAPVQTRLTLQFKETDIVDKNKVLLGY